MYIPKIYKNENQDEIIEFLKANAFGILINQNNGAIAATHIPLEFEIKDNKQYLVGHVSRANQQWKTFEKNDQVLAIFSGAHTYISPSWYDHENVPTWNYIAVHVLGKINIIEGEAVLESLKKLVNKYESGKENPTKVDDYSTETMQQIDGIVAFEIEIIDIQAVKKMSQNRDDKNYNNIISELEKSTNINDNLVATEMKKCTR